MPTTMKPKCPGCGVRPAAAVVHTPYSVECAEWRDERRTSQMERDE